MKSMDVRDFVGGLMVAAVGAAFALAAQSLPSGPPNQVGPAYVPTAVGLIAVGLGLLISGRAFLVSNPFPRPNLRPVIAIFATVAVFGLMIKSTGLIPTLITCVIVASLGSPKTRPIPILLVALGVGIGCWLIFIVALGLPIAAIRNPL